MITPREPAEPENWFDLPPIERDLRAMDRQLAKHPEPVPLAPEEGPPFVFERAEPEVEREVADYIAELALSHPDASPDGPSPQHVSDLANPPSALPAHLTRQSLAAWHFACMAGDHVRFDHGRDVWMLWSSHRWVPDPIGQVNELWRRVLARRYELALAIADEKARDRAVKGIQDAGASDGAINGGLHIASSMSPLATAADAWDRDPYLLGCANGVVDLRTGRLRPGRPEDMISRSTGIVYDAEATCPRWLQFLLEDFGDDDALAEWFGLLIGASLIGEPIELLAIWYGGGNNGKSIAIAALRRAVGEYGVPVGVETLVDARRRAGAATPDLMPLRGARLVFMTEPDQKAKLSGGALKRLASIDNLPGRELFGKQVNWTPTHTIHLATNHLPGADDASEGFWRRVALVPWSVHFRKPGESGDGPLEDGGLGAVLLSEAPAILAWAVRGSVAILAGGRSLWPFPGAVRVKTAAYRRDEDQLAAFITEQVVYELGASVRRVELHRAYIARCDAEQIPLGDRLKARAFGAEFEAHGRVQHGTDDHERAIFRGARLRHEGDLWEAEEAAEDRVPGFEIQFAKVPTCTGESESLQSTLPTREPGAPTPDLSTNGVDGRAEEEGEPALPDPLAWLRDQLAAGVLVDHAPVQLTAGQRIDDVITAIRGWLLDAERGGRIGAVAQARLGQLEAILRAEEAAR